VSGSAPEAVIYGRQGYETVRMASGNREFHVITMNSSLFIEYLSNEADSHEAPDIDIFRPP